MEATCWLTPVGSWEDKTPEEIIQTLVAREGVYALSMKNRNKPLKVGDWICFYIPRRGIVAHARVATIPEIKTHRAIYDSQRYPLVFHLEQTSVYLDNPVPIGTNIRKDLDAFQGRDLGKPWSWFVQSTKKISQHDFEILTAAYSDKR